MCYRTRAGGCPRLSWPVPAVPAAVSRTLATALLPLLLTLTVHLIPAQVFAADTAQPAALQAGPASVPHQKNSTTPADTGADTPIMVSDDTGHVVRLQQPARRVIALYGAFNELLLALGAGDVLAARTVADAAVPGLEHLPAIGTHMRPNAELVVRQSPDLVIQLAGRNEALLQTENLRALGLDVLVFEMNSFEQMFAVLQKLGRLTGRESEASALVKAWRERLAALEARYADMEPVSVFYEVRSPNLLGAGRGGIELCIRDSLSCFRA